MATPQTQDRLANYVPVNERLEQFYSDHENGRVLTAIVEHNAEDGFILMRAEVYRTQDDAAPAATGHAFENRSEGYVNKTSYIENCETSAVGRALALLGYEIKRGIASREEMQKVQRMTGNSEQVISVKQAADILALIDEVKADKPKFLQYMQAKSIAEIPASMFDKAVRALEKKRKAVA